MPGLAKGAPRAGDRFPWLHLKLSNGPGTEDLFQKLDDTRFNLLVFSQSRFARESLDRSALLKLHVIADDAVNDAELSRAHIDRRSTYLLRPDGHIGLCGIDLARNAIDGYLKDRVCLAKFETVSPAP
jgi:hypothetical protein